MKTSSSNRVVPGPNFDAEYLKRGCVRIGSFSSAKRRHKSI